MEFVTPELDVPIIRLAEDQPEYRPIDVARIDNENYASILVDGKVLPNTNIVAMRLSPEERQQVLDGDDIYISLLTFGQPMQPILAMVGKAMVAKAFDITAT